MGKFLELCVTECGWEYVRRINCAGAVIVLVYHTENDRYLMVEQYRPAVSSRVLEHPAGLVDDGETDEQAAVRELAEETGLVATEADLIDLGIIFGGVGMTDEEVHLFAVEIDDTYEIKRADIQGAEHQHKLISKWVCEKDLFTTKAAKALSVYARYHAWKKDPEIRFET